jgi:arylsulfatase A-like enzyme
LAARRACYAPALFGYTDQSVDPRVTDGPEDRRLSSYEGVLPGFDATCELLASDPAPWCDWLRAKGHAIADEPDAVLASEPERPAEHSMSAYLTDRFLEWASAQRRPWFAHLSQFRPHPPFAAAGHFSRLYRPDEAPAPIAMAAQRHWLHDRLLAQPALAAPADALAMRRMQSQYFGMVSEADHQVGRVVAGLQASGDWDDTFVVVTSDHGEQLGDHGLIQKFGWFESSYHVLGVIRDPRAGAARNAVVDQFTENIDVFPTLCEAMKLTQPAQCDGLPLTPFLQGQPPPSWRDAAHW